MYQITPEETMRRLRILLGYDQLRQDTKLSLKTIQSWQVDRTAGGKTNQTPSRGPLRLLLHWARLCVKYGRSDIVLAIIYQFMAIVFPTESDENEQ